MQNNQSEITDEDRVLIEQQLGRAPRGLRAVAIRTNQGLPVVLQIDSVVEGELFPTLFWLCSKDLYKAIAEIETAGFVKTLDERICHDEVLKQRLFDDHKRYTALRASFLSDEQKVFLKANNYEEVLAQMGIGGSRHWHTVRCLHMHYAHHLADKNCIGEILDDEFSLNDLLLQR